MHCVTQLVWIRKLTGFEFIISLATLKPKTLGIGHCTTLRWVALSYLFQFTRFREEHSFQNEWNGSKCLCQCQRKLSDWILGKMRFNSILGYSSIAMRLCFGISNDSKNQWNDFDALLWHTKRAMGIKQSTKRPYKCNFTIPLCTTTTAPASYCHFAVCNVQWALSNVCIHIETIDILFIEMTFALSKIFIVMFNAIRSVLSAMYASLRLALKRKNWKQRKRTQKKQ